MNFIEDFISYSKSEDTNSSINSDIDHTIFRFPYKNTGIFIRKVGTKIPAFLYNKYTFVNGLDHNLKQINIYKSYLRCPKLNSFLKSANIRSYNSCLKLDYINLEDYDKRIYYGPGIMLDNDFNVILLFVYDTTINDNLQIELKKPYLYITSNIFQEQKDKLYKHIFKSLNNNDFDVCLYVPFTVKDTKMEIIINDKQSNAFILKPNCPTTDNINESLNGILINNIDFVIENLCNGITL